MPKYRKTASKASSNIFSQKFAALNKKNSTPTYQVLSSEYYAGGA